MNQTKEQKNDSEIALLAPVPLVHLLSGLDVKEWVAFGSLAYDVFHRLDKERSGLDVDVYVYASLHDGSNVSQYWRATYIGMSEWDDELSKHRPASTADETGWGIFWKVKNLRVVSPGEWRIDEMKGFGKSTKYTRFFIPEGPILIRHP